MAKQMTTEQAIGAFRFRAAALIQQGKSKLSELRELFADCAAAAMMVEGDEALEEMSYVLRDMLAAPIRESERDTFDDMRHWEANTFDDMRPWANK